MVPHSFTHALSFRYKITTFLNDSVTILSDLFNLALDRFSDRFRQGFVACGPICIGRSDFVLNGNELLMTRFDSFKQRLPIHDKR